MTVELWPGQSYPLGARYDGVGTNFSLFSETARRVELCLFDDRGREQRIELTEVDAFCWHGYLPNVGPGQRYGYRVHGPWDPTRGLRCNANKLLLDPYAKAIDGRLRWHEAVFDHPFDDEHARNDLNSAPFVPRSVVTSPYFDWDNDHHPKRPWHDTVIYETHVKGLTARHPDVPRELRGTYLGVSHPAVVEHLLELGVTAVELLPVHQFISEHALAKRGLSNYWGYNSIGYFAPHSGYAAPAQPGGVVQQFQTMVRQLHAAGMEVILDVVYNHTAEGNHLGPTLSLKGIDNQAYYRLVDGDARHYMDYTGTGNSLNMRHPHVLQMIMDSLRYWVLHMHVDGFRFDLAATLARELHDVDRLSTFFEVIQQDPVISQVKLIAEPWDIGEGGYQVGNFPPQWSEWNGKYRDTVRDFWRGSPSTLADFGYRFTGSSDLYESGTRRPSASINFVTAHDGFPLADLVSYNDKHNTENGENNQDGTDDNRSWNCGEEGPSDDPDVLACRARQQRNFLTTLFLSQGVPMLLGGDELGRTQHGNNNAYCQDNEISWYDWHHVDTDLVEFTARVIELRREHPVFQRRRWFQGRRIHGADVTDIAWFTPAGEQMSEERWLQDHARSLQVFLYGEGIPTLDDRGNRILDDSFLLLLNAHHERLTFTLPQAYWGEVWTEILDTTKPVPTEGEQILAGGVRVVTGRSLVLLRQDS